MLGYADREYWRDPALYGQWEPNPKVYQVGYGHQNRTVETYGSIREDTGCDREANNCKHTPPQVCVQAEGNKTDTVQLIEQRLGKLENLVADSVEKIMSRIKQLVIEIREVKKEIGELH